MLVLLPSVFVSDSDSELLTWRCPLEVVCSNPISQSISFLPYLGGFLFLFKVEL